MSYLHVSSTTQNLSVTTMIFGTRCHVHVLLNWFQLHLGCISVRHT